MNLASMIYLVHIIGKFSVSGLPDLNIMLQK